MQSANQWLNASYELVIFINESISLIDSLVINNWVTGRIESLIANDKNFICFKIVENKNAKLILIFKYMFIWIIIVYIIFIIFYEPYILGTYNFEFYSFGNYFRDSFWVSQFGTLFFEGGKIFLWQLQNGLFQLPFRPLTLGSECFETFFLKPNILGILVCYFIITLFYYYFSQ